MACIVRFWFPLRPLLGHFLVSTCFDTIVSIILSSIFRFFFRRNGMAFWEDTGAKG
ncbi:hypothetical protein BDV28DRAFT_133404 [Aspergillus coremiiformis]|uniref:Uncharacterized protein n=1 Tax=Aspergillus coremiiformis TaxID=138285 RepID=A0A5N6Z6N3_9EURO|nr:hypothetical protein BDV28DRAFT_133404 [Aspergillus coremiiformis]